MLPPLLHYFQLSSYWQTVNVSKHVCELLISSNITKLPTFSLDKLHLFQHLVNSVNPQPKLVGCFSFFFFSCLNLLQRRWKVRFWHTIMILAVLEPETSCVPVRYLVQPSVSDQVWPLQQHVSFIMWSEPTPEKLIAHSVFSTAQKASRCFLCCCHQPCLTELWGHLASSSLSGSILINSLDSLRTPCTHRCLLFQHTITWDWCKSCFDWHTKRLQYETLLVQSKRFTYRWPQNSSKKPTLYVLLELVVDVVCSCNLHQFRMFKNAAWDVQQCYTSWTASLLSL